MDCNYASDQPPDLEELRQQNETVLTVLESHFLGALLTNDWTQFDQFLSDFKQCTSTQKTTTAEVVEDKDCLNDPIAMILEITRLKAEASADELDTRSADFSQTTEVNQS